MKKLSTLIAMILIATIGGVYATWTYVGDSQVHSMSTKGVVMTDLETTKLSVGTYHINSNLDQGIIDQNKDTEPGQPYHKALLSYKLKDGATQATFSVEFVPDAGVSAEVAEKGIISYMWFGAPDMKYDCNGDGTADDIFLVPHGEDNYITIHPVGTDLNGMNRHTNLVWVKEGNKFVCNFIGEGLEHTGFESIFTLNNVVLDTEAKYEAYKSSITKFIRGVISNKTPAETVIGSTNAQ